jgi:hypothetical protein
MTFADYMVLFLALWLVSGLIIFLIIVYVTWYRGDDITYQELFEYGIFFTIKGFISVAAALYEVCLHIKEKYQNRKFMKINLKKVAIKGRASAKVEAALRKD